MIRMGRSSKMEDGNGIDEPSEKPSNLSSAYQYSSNQPSSSNRAVSESESMARDIKEGRLSGFFGNGTTLNGETNFQAMLRIDGHLTGSIKSEGGTLVVGSTGKVDANVAVATAIVSGTVNGDIVAAEKIELGRTARIVGNIQTARLIIEDGAILEGSCSMLKAKESFDKRIDRPNSYSASNNYPLEVDESEETDEVAETAQAAVN
ncbi:hypothetical protein BH20ACI1_BH20ACI1_24200 [soil metagenome]